MLLNPLDYVIYSYQRLEEERIYIYIYIKSKISMPSESPLKNCIAYTTKHMSDKEYSNMRTFNLFLKQRTPIYPIKKRNILPLSAPITINAKTNKKNNRLYLNRSSLNK